MVVIGRKPVIIDTDPGHDDAFALLLALASPEELDVQAITTVAGNVSLRKTTYNALRVRELGGAPHIPVYRGCSRPLVNELVTAEYIHGESGLDGPKLPEPSRDVEATHAVDFLIEALRNPPEPITLCVLGPMTNIASALTQAPDIVAGISELVIMGGSFHAGGNVTQAAEFNVFVDPHAADVVLNCGVPLIMMPLDVTHQAQATQSRVAALRNLGTPVGKAATEMLRFVERYDRTHHGFEGFPLHDPTVVAFLVDPSLFDSRPGRFSVSLAAGTSHGATSAEWRIREHEANGRAALGLDADGYFDLIAERLAVL